MHWSRTLLLSIIFSSMFSLHAKSKVWQRAAVFSSCTSRRDALWFAACNCGEHVTHYHKLCHNTWKTHEQSFKQPSCMSPIQIWCLLHIHLPALPARLRFLFLSPIAAPALPLANTCARLHLPKTENVLLEWLTMCTRVHSAARYVLFQLRSRADVRQTKAFRNCLRQKLVNNMKMIIARPQTLKNLFVSTV